MLNKAAVKGGKYDVDRRFNFWYNVNKAAVKRIEVVFTASLRSEIYDWTSTGSKRIE